MLIEFKTANYRSIGEEQVLSLVPAPKQRDHLRNIIHSGPHQALNALGIYGPNGGGKSNLLRAMNLMDQMVHSSARTSSTALLPYDPFLLRSGWDKKPTSFEITFVIEEVRYRYRFEYTATEIQQEWLFRKSVGREVNLFSREGETIEVSTGFSASKKLVDAAIEATRNNALFLSTCDMLNIEEAKKILRWFKTFAMVDGLNTELEEIQSVGLWNHEAFQGKIRGYLIALGLNIVDVDVAHKEWEEWDSPETISIPISQPFNKVSLQNLSYSVLAKHRVYGSDGLPTDQLHAWNWEERESSGAIKAFQLSGPILWALARGGVLIIDEIEAKLHPILTLNTIDAFLDPKSNPNHAQLIFATHDTNLLSHSTLRRDQIYFAEKNKWESTEIYSLSDFVYFGERNGETFEEKERPDTDKEKRYFEGRYGAIPALGGFKQFITKEQWQKGEA